jgi:hypothetical protein
VRDRKGARVMKVSDATTAQLKNLLAELNFSIDRIESYSAKDLIIRELVLNELEKRGG